jgi:hypothetical protein
MTDPPFLDWQVLTDERLIDLKGNLPRSTAAPPRVPPDVYCSFGFPGAEDMGNMFQFKRDFEQAYRGARNVDFSRALNPALQTFEGWLKSNSSRIPLE